MKNSTLRMGRVNQAEKKVTMMVGLMIFAFLLAWTPYSVFALVEQFGDPDIISPALAILPALIAKTSICYNPVIYVGMNSQVSFYRFIEKSINRIYYLMLNKYFHHTLFHK